MVIDGESQIVRISNEECRAQVNGLRVDPWHVRLLGSGLWIPET